MSTIINGTTGVTYPDGVTQGSGTPTASATSGAPLVSNGTIFTQTTPVGAAFGGTGLNSAGASGNVLQSNGTTWVSSANPPAFVSGTLMLFQQTAAPTGWTKQTTHDNKALRVVSGTAGSGGTTAFTSVFANQTPTFTGAIGSLAGGATTLSTAQMPSHNHSAQGPAQAFGENSYAGGGTLFTDVTGNTGGGGSHTHSITGTPGGSVGAVTLNVQYVDLIIASKA